MSSSQDASSTNIWDEKVAGNIIWEDENAIGTPYSRFLSSDLTLIEVLTKTSGQKLKLRAATLNKLVEEITPLSNPDNEFVKLFLLTYPSFTTDHALFSTLKQRYEGMELSPCKAYAHSSVPRDGADDDVSYKQRALPIQYAPSS